MLALLLACADPPAETGADSATDTAGDTGTIPDEAVVYVGAEGDGAGAALAGDGAGAIAIGAPLGGKVCVLAGPFSPGTRAYDEGATCFEQEAFAQFPGWALSPAGDTDLDGNVELLVSALGNDDGGYLAGKVYLLEGPWDGGAHSLSEAPASWIGEAAGDYLGASVAAVGDMDDDGGIEVAFGAYGNDTLGAEAGRVYLFRAPFSGGVHPVSEAAVTLVADLPEGSRPPPPHNTESVGDAVGSALSGAGDFDGDGLADLLVGIDANDRGGDGAGAAAIYFGPLPDGAYTLDDADRLWVGEAGEYAGWSVAGLGDADGDGYSEVAVSGDTLGPGHVWVLAGPGQAGQSALADTGILYTGEADYDLNLPALAGVGDADGDGAADLLVGASFHDRAAYDAGTAFLVSGPFTPGTWSLADATPVRSGDAEYDYAGATVSGAGDLDGDGIMDLLVGAPESDGAAHGAGKVWVETGGTP